MLVSPHHLAPLDYPDHRDRSISASLRRARPLNNFDANPLGASRRLYY